LSIIAVITASASLTWSYACSSVTIARNAGGNASVPRGFP